MLKNSTYYLTIIQLLTIATGIISLLIYTFSN